MTHLQAWGGALLLLVAPVAAMSQPSSLATLPKLAQEYARQHSYTQSRTVETYEDQDDQDQQIDNVRNVIQDNILDITSHAGLRQNFIAIPADIPNAMAFMHNGRRVLYYNVNFMQSAHDDIDPDWAVLSILAHEIGHHLLGHIFVLDNRFKDREIEADEFSGFMLYRMGAKIDEATVAIRVYAMDVDTPSYPARAARVAAIERGWRAAAAITVHEAELARRRNAR